MPGREPLGAEESRRQAVDRAARALTRAIVDLAEAVSMPRGVPQPALAEARRDPRDVLTLRQVSEITGLSEKTFYNLRNKNEGPPFFVVRNRLRCFRVDLEAWMIEKARA